MNFINNYITYINNFLSKDFPDIKLMSFDIDKEKNYQYSEQESPLHNSVDFLNMKLLREINNNCNLLEIGCGTNSIILKSDNYFLKRKDGLDILETDFNGRNTLANIIGSVSKIPLRSNYYDFCVSNQSIEHWFEYGVSINKGLKEISRILKKDNGKLYINFPLFLHGKREFVQGDLEKILTDISKVLNIKSIVFVYSSSKEYKGWIKCKQPKFRVKNFIKSKGINQIPYSFVCEIVATRKEELLLKKNKKIFSVRRINLLKDYTLMEIFFKVLEKFK